MNSFHSVLIKGAAILNLELWVARLPLAFWAELPTFPMTQSTLNWENLSSKSHVAMYICTNCCSVSSYVQRFNVFPSLEAADYETKSKRKSSFSEHWQVAYLFLRQVQASLNVKSACLHAHYGHVHSVPVLDLKNPVTLCQDVLNSVAQRR